jgi:hypothetical protein
MVNRNSTISVVVGCVLLSAGLVLMMRSAGSIVHGPGFQVDPGWGAPSAIAVMNLSALGGALLWTPLIRRRAVPASPTLRAASQLAAIAYIASAIAPAAAMCLFGGIPESIVFGMMPAIHGWAFWRLRGRARLMLGWIAGILLASVPITLGCGSWDTGWRLIFAVIPFWGLALGPLCGLPIAWRWTRKAERAWDAQGAGDAGLHADAI